MFNKIKNILLFIVTLSTGYYMGQWSSQFESYDPSGTESVIMFTLSSILIKIIFSEEVHNA